MPSPNFGEGFFLEKSGDLIIERPVTITVEKRRLRKEIFAWTLYDFANTSYSVIVVTVVYAIYFKEYIVGDFTISLGGWVRNPGDFLWGLGGSISMAIVALSSPIMGAIADYSNRKKRFLFVYTMACVSVMALLYFLEPGMIVAGLLLFIIGNIGFEGALVFYNGFLPQISTPQNIGKISGYGFAVGYVGSLISLLIALPYATRAFAANDLSIMRPTFVLAAAFFFVFSLPFFVLVKERIVNAPAVSGNYIKAGYRRTLQTIKRMREFPEILKFLLAYFIYIDGVNTVIYFSGIFASTTLGFSMREVIQFFAIVQSSAISGAYVFGYLTDKFGPKKTIMITLLLWIVVTIGAYFTHSASMFYVVGLIAGVAMGSSQSASRALMGKLIPRGMEAEFYGFYALMGKFSSILGPFTFGLVSILTGSQRYAIISLLFFFVTGLILINRVNEKVTYKRFVL